MLLLITWASVTCKIHLILIYYKAWEWSGPVFLISLYGAPLTQRASYLALQSSLFGPVVQVHIIMIILSLNSINSLLICSRCIPNGTHTNHCWVNLAHASKLIKNPDLVPHDMTNQPLFLQTKVCVFPV